jgi:hypothetical protein
MAATTQPNNSLKCPETEGSFHGHGISGDAAGGPRARRTVRLLRRTDAARSRPRRHLCSGASRKQMGNARHVRQVLVRAQSRSPARSARERCVTRRGVRSRGILNSDCNGTRSIFAKRLTVCYGAHGDTRVYAALYDINGHASIRNVDVSLSAGS